MWCDFVWIFAIASTLTDAVTLDLSFKEMKKEDFFRNENGSVSEQIEKATELNLRGNAFDNFIDCSGKLDKVEILDLSQNLLKSFYFECMEEDHLFSLNVSHNKLSFLHDQALTKRISKLQILDLSYNVIHTITDETFQHMENLRLLSFCQNPIGNNISHNAFRNLLSLEKLELCNIAISILPADIFTPLVSLRYLSLASNPIESVPTLPIGIETLDISGTNILHLENLNSPRLITLTMGSMPRIESFDFNQIKKLEKLAVLSMDNCPRLKKLTAIPPVDTLKDLKQISVENCVIEKLGDDLQPIMQRTTKLDLQGNPWHCDCGMKWILDLNSTIEYRGHIRCQTPPELQGKLVFEIPVEEFWCNKINYLALWLSLGTITFIACMAALIYFRRDSIRKWVTKSSRGDTVTYKNMKANTNDTEKILEHSDVTDYP